MRTLSLAVVVALVAGCATEPELASSDEALSLRSIDPHKELVITDPSVIRAPLETAFDPAHPSGFSQRGAWSFGRIVHNMLPRGQRDSAVAASQLVFEWLHAWESDQAPNPEVSASRARPGMRLLITNPWKAASGCAEPASRETDDTCVLDLAKAPFRLMAIVYRPDLRVVAGDATSSGGEGRFVFQAFGPTIGIDTATNALAVMDPTVKAQKMTVNVEFSLPVFHDIETLLWAYRWHVLGSLPFGPAYNAWLRSITNDFSGPDRDPRRPNGNALDQLRTNEVASFGARFPAPGFTAAKQFWELREFHLTATGLVQHTVNDEASRDFDIAHAGQIAGEGTRPAELAAYLAANATTVLAQQQVLPDALLGNSALVGSAPYGAWGKLVNPNPPTIPSSGVANDLGVDIAVRDAYAMGTCAGCHRHETDTRHFMHITFVGAMEPLDRVDDRARIGLDATTPDDTVALSNVLAADIADGGGRNTDYRNLLATNLRDLREFVGRPACASHGR